MELIILLVVAAVIVSLFSGGSSRANVEYELHQLDRQDVQGEPGEGDFASFSRLKDHVIQDLRQSVCHECGKPITGKGLVIAYGKVRLHRTEYSRWFGVTTKRDVHYATMWRIHGMMLKPGHVSGWFTAAVEPAKLECKACGWKQEGALLPARSISDALGIEWVTAAELLNAAKRRP